MDKYEYKLKLDQIKSLVAARDYEAASAIADTINWDRVRNSNTLMMVARIYEETDRYEACRDVLLHAYDHSSLGRNIVSQLADVAIKAKRVDEAEEYYNEFLEIAPRDNKRYVIAYKISCLKNAPLSDRIAILEELKEREYSEIWAYELAALYSEADMREKCVETCDELILWFGEGEYVEKALDLKRRFQPLTAAQEEKYRRLREARGIVDIPVSRKVEATISEDTGLPDITVSKFNTMNLQEELAKSMQQIMEATERETVSGTMDSIKKIVNDIPYLSGEIEETDQEIMDQERINEAVDETLKADFSKRMAHADYTYTRPVPSASAGQVAGQMSIEEVLADWEKTKLAAEEAIAAAEQRKLELAKQQALTEANEIMERLQSLLPVLSADPDDLPEEGGTVASALLSDDPTVKDPDLQQREQLENELLERELTAKEAAHRDAQSESGSAVDTEPASEGSSVAEDMIIEEEIAAVRFDIDEEAVLSEDTVVDEDVLTEDIAVDGEALTEDIAVDGEALTEDIAVDGEALTEDIAVDGDVLTDDIAAGETVITEDTYIVEDALAEDPAADETSADRVSAESAVSDGFTEEEAAADYISAEDTADITATEDTASDDTYHTEEAVPLRHEVDSAVEAYERAVNSVHDAPAQTWEEAAGDDLTAPAEEQYDASQNVYEEEAAADQNEYEDTADYTAGADICEDAADTAQDAYEESADYTAEADTYENAADTDRDAYEESADYTAEADTFDNAADTARDVYEESVDYVSGADNYEEAADAAQNTYEDTADYTAGTDLYDEPSDTAQNIYEDTSAADTESGSYDDTAEDSYAEAEEEPEQRASYGGILSEEDRRMFSYFLPVPGVEEQICQVLKDSERYIGNTVTSLTGNLIVQGEEGSGKTVLATSLIKAIQKIVGNEGAKIGKISAEALNRKNFAALVPRLEGGYLIIDKAGDLTKETVQKMSRVMERNTQGLVIVLEDDSAGIRRALGQDPLFAKKFTGRVKIPVFTIDELVDFGKAYALEMECVMDEMAILALYNRINMIRRLDHPTSLTEVKEIVDQAIESAEGGGIKKLFAKKYNANDYLILREKDFELQ